MKRLLVIALGLASLAGCYGPYYGRPYGRPYYGPRYRPRPAYAAPVYVRPAPAYGTVYVPPPRAY